MIRKLLLFLLLPFATYAQQTGSPATGGYVVKPQNTAYIKGMGIEAQMRVYFGSNQYFDIPTLKQTQFKVDSSGALKFPIQRPITDMNTISQNSGYNIFYSNMNPANGFSNSYYQGIQFSADQNPLFRNQLFFDTNGGLYTRSMFNGNWLPYKQIINRDDLTNYQLIPDGLQSVSSITQSGNIVTVNNAVWRINQVNYTAPGAVNLTIAAATTGFKRVDLIVGNTSNQLTVVQGVENATTAVEPNLPANTARIAPVYVNGTTVSPPQPDLNEYAKKSEVVPRQTQVTDLNNVTNANSNFGFFYSSGTAANTPFGTSFNQGIQVSADQNPQFLNQLSFDVTGGLFTRTKLNGVWGTWNRLGTGTVSSVASANTDISVTNPTSTPVISLDNVNGITKSFYDPTSSIQGQLNNRVTLNTTQTIPGYKVLGRVDVRGSDTTLATGVTGYASTVVTRRSIFNSNNNETVLMSFRPLSTTNTDPGTSLPYTGNNAKAFDWTGDISGPVSGTATIGGTRPINSLTANAVTSNGNLTGLTLNSLNNLPIGFGAGSQFGFMDVSSNGTQRNRFVWGNATALAEAKMAVNNSNLYATGGQVSGIRNEGNLNASVDNDLLVGFRSSATYGLGTTAISTFTTSFSGTGTPAANSQYTFTGGSGSGAIFSVSFANNATSATITRVSGGTGYTVGNVLTRTINGLTINITVTAVGLTGVKAYSFYAENAPLYISNSAINTATSSATVLMRETDGTVTQTASNARIPLDVTANATMALNRDYLNKTATQYTLTLPPCNDWNVDGSKIITVLATGTGGVRISVPSGYSLQAGTIFATTTGSGGATLTQGQKVQLVPVGVNAYSLQAFNGTVTVN